MSQTRDGKVLNEIELKRPHFFLLYLLKPPQKLFEEMHMAFIMKILFFFSKHNLLLWLKT